MRAVTLAFVVIAITQTEGFNQGRSNTLLDQAREKERSKIANLVEEEKTILTNLAEKLDELKDGGGGDKQPYLHSDTYYDDLQKNDDDEDETPVHKETIYYKSDDYYPDDPDDDEDKGSDLEDQELKKMEELLMQEGELLEDISKEVHLLENEKAAHSRPHPIKNEMVFTQ